MNDDRKNIAKVKNADRRKGDLILFDSNNIGTSIFSFLNPSKTTKSINNRISVFQFMPLIRSSDGAVAAIDANARTSAIVNSASFFKKQKAFEKTLFLFILFDLVPHRIECEYCSI